MAEFKQGVLTAKGLDLLAKAQAGTCKITFTKFQIGDGTWDNPSMETLMATLSLKNKRAEFPVSKAEFANDATSKLTLVASNAENTTSGYFIREVAIWASDGSSEIMYAIFIANQADWFPVYNSITPSSITYSCYVAVGNASTVTVKDATASLVTKADLDEVEDEVRFDTDTSVRMLTNTLRQVSWAQRADAAELDKMQLLEKGSVTLTNSETFPFNNSQKSVSLAAERATKDYIVTIVSATASTGNVGEVIVSDKLVNGFKLAFTGSAASVTVEYMVTGGYYG